MKCPVCGEELPLLSKVCPVCGYVLDGETGETPKAAEYIESLESKLSGLKRMPMPTFGQSFKDAQVILCPVFTVVCLVLALVTEAGLFWIAAAIFVILFVVFFIIKLRSESFSKKKIEFEEEMRTARRYFGKNREMGKELEAFSEEVDAIENARKALSRKNIIIWVILISIIAISVCAAFFAGRDAHTVSSTTAQSAINNTI